ncbi:glycosyltransferase [Candidatus Gottesmanbacteria bacterium]|nr:glycosyltransferase [Candidatus Gottesmanbacteria bacterium]
MKIALVHDYLREYGGAERVLEVMHEMWPDAPLYTSFVDWPSMREHAKRFQGWDIRTSWVQKYPFIKRWISPLRFLAPKIWKSFDFSEYDVVIFSSGWFMCRGVALNKRLETGDRRLDGLSSAEVANKNLDPSSDSNSPSPSTRSLRESEDGLNFYGSPQSSRKPLHICYIHHPPRNLYGYATGSDLQKYWFVRVYAAIVNFFLRQYDFDSAQAVDYFVANSKETARRVEKFYRRDSVVVYPPIDVSRVKSQGSSKKSNIPHDPLTHDTKNYFLSVGRLTYAKRVDLAILACNTLKLPLKIVGKGKEEEYLRSIAGPTVEFLGGVSDEKLNKLYSGARTLIFSALDEDFGMVPVEAMAHGTPVIGLSQGGVKETVVDGVTGILFDEATVSSLESAMKRFMSMKKEWSSDCKKQADKFSKARFKKELDEYVNGMYKKVRIEANV